MGMTYEKIGKHQAFVREKSEALKNKDFDFNKSTLRNKRLMQLNNMIMEKLIELNAQTMNVAFSGSFEDPESKATAGTAADENLIKIEGVKMDPVEFCKLLRNAPPVNIVDAVPEIIESYNVSKECGLDEY